MSLRTGAIEAVARRLNEDGWTCEGHEPGGWCEPCKKVQTLTAGREIDALLDYLEAHIDEWELAASDVAGAPVFDGRLLIVALRGES